MTAIMPDNQRGDRTRSGIPTARISTETVQLFRKHTGRGPSKAHTAVAGDIVLITLGDTLSKGERVLVSQGREQEVLDVRRGYQEIMRSELSALVERYLNRRVLGFVSFDNVGSETAYEIFMLDGSKPEPD